MAEQDQNTMRWWIIIGLVGCAVGLLGGLALSVLTWAGLGIALLSFVVLFIQLEGESTTTEPSVADVETPASPMPNIGDKLQVTTAELGMAVEAIESVTQTQTLGAAEQSRVIAEMRTKLEEFLDLSDRTSSQAQQVTQMGQQLTVTAEAGQTAIYAATDVMDQIRKQVAVIAETIATLARLTRRIETIITSVGEIATQSNLLALNASIEAARAGTHGRGFAVVADEVRVLAGQSTDAAGEVRTLLREVQAAISETIDATQVGMTEVNQGVMQTRRANEVIEQISGEVTRANEMTQAIHEVIQRQAEGLELITMNVEQMNHVTRQNSQEMQVISTVSANLTRLSGELQRVLKADGQPV